MRAFRAVAVCRELLNMLTPPQIGNLFRLEHEYKIKLPYKEVSGKKNLFLVA